MKNVQITIDQSTLEQVDRIGKPLGLKRSEIVRQALRDWLRKNAVDGFEQEWITALKKKPDEAARAERWIGTQAWSKK
jgi:metal-responsive CopG/Arc/MetJ family transcriptional regulator